MEIESRTDRHATRLKRLAIAGEFLAWGSFAVTVLGVVAAMMLPDMRGAWFASLGVRLDANPMIATVIAAIPAALFAFCLWEAATLFGALRGAVPFSSRAISALVRLGWGAVATAVASIVSRMSLAYIASLGSADGSRALAISLSSTDLGALLVGILALVFALVVAEARQLEYDARGIV